MIYPDMIDKVFAENGEKEVPPQLSSNNFVNFDTGYTPDYELRLGSTNPQAKAVERQIQNYLFGELFKCAKAWQSQGFSAWYPSMPGGYAKNSRVLHIVNGTVLPYRSLVDQNMSTPGSDASRWEYEQGSAEMIANIPMPAGGQGGSSAFLITNGGAAFQPTVLSRGTYVFVTDAAAQATPGLPSDGTNQRSAGLLEVITYGDQGRICRYVDRRGTAYILPSATSAWKVQTSQDGFQSGKAIYGIATGSANVISLSIVPAPSELSDGMQVRFKPISSNTAATTFNLNLSGAKPILGQANLPLAGGEIVAGIPVVLQWNEALASWVIVSASPRQQTLAATKGSHAPSWAQVEAAIEAASVVRWDDVLDKPSVVINGDLSATINRLELKRIAGASGVDPVITYKQSASGSGFDYSAGLSADGRYSISTSTYRIMAFGSTIDADRLLNVNAGISIQGQASGPIVRFNSVEGSLQYAFRQTDATFIMYSYPQEGAAFTAFSLRRTDGRVTLATRPMFGSDTPWDSGNLDLCGAVQGFFHSDPGEGWLPCNGQAISRAAYARLFSKIGTTFGSGNGSTTFNVPDTRGKFLRDLDRGANIDPSRAMGTVQGDANKSHSHSGTAASAGAHIHDATATSAGAHTHTVSGATNSAGAHSHTFTVSNRVQGSVETLDMVENRTVNRTIQTSTAGAHTHDVSGSAQSAGDHTHTVSVVSNGAHSHNLNINNDGTSESRPVNLTVNYYIHI